MFSREQGEGMDLTVCPKCQRDLLRPKTLPCLHTFCLSCLKGISGDPACFICKDAFEGDPASLPTFPLVTALVDQKSSAPKDVNEIRCICEEELATSFCGVCAEYLCGRCSTSHRRSKATSSHEQLSVEEQLRAPAPRVLHCPLHPGQDVDVFCRRCQVAVCYKCGIKHHAGHDLGEIAEGGDLASSALTEALPKLEKAAGQIGQAREQFEPLLKKIGESEERESQAIRQEFSAMRQTLDQRERKVLVLVEEIARQKREALLEQLGSLALDHSAHQIALDLAHATLRQGTQQEILASARSLLDRMQALEQRFIELKALEDEKIEFVRSGVEEAKRQLALLGDVDGGQPVAQSSFVRGDKFRPWCKPGEKVLVEAVGVTKAGQEITRAVGGFRMEVTGPCGSLVAKVPMRNMSQGGVVGEFAAEEAGIYRVRVTLHGQLIKGGELRVHAATASPAHSFLEWRAEAGSVTLTVTSCDASGNRLVGGGGSFQVTVAEEGSFFTMGGEPLDVPQTLVDNGDGTYTARFQPKGPWRAQATLGGRQIKNSPCAPFEALFSSPKKFALLYNAKQDGFSSQIHQQKCGSTNNTLTLVTLKDGRMFGGFKPAAGTNGDLAAPNPGPGAGFPFASPAGGGAFGTPPTAGFGSAGTTSGGFSFGGTSAFGASGTAPGCGFSFGGPSSSTPAGASAYSFANTPSPGAAGTSFGGTTASAFAPTNEPVGEPFLFAFAPEGLLKFKRNHSQIGVGHCFTPRGPAFGAGNDLSIDLDSPANSRSSPCYYELPSKEALAGSQGNWQIDNVQVYRVGPSSAVPRA